jgi:outer membrane protein OmpA-like peptidoglycan-associated protein
MTLGVRKTKLLGVAAVAFIAVGASACSSLPDVPDWVDPTTWFGSDDNASAADSAQTPDLASLPDKPAASTPDDQKQVADTLRADRRNADYSADALRGGTEAAAAPPPDVAPAQTAAAEEMEQPKSAKPSATPAPSQPTRVASVDRSIAQQPTGTTMPGTLPATPPGTAVAAVPPPPQAVETAALPEPPAAAPQPAPEPPIRRSVASAAAPEPTAPPPGAQPALPPTPAVPQQVAAINPSDAALGFQPSKAPPLDPSISQFVPAAIVDHYRQTAANAGVMMGSGPSGIAAARPARKLHRPAHVTAIGGPEHMSGAVVANLDALQQSTAVSRPSAYANPQGLPATAVIFFPDDSVALSAEGRAQVRAAVEQYKADGGVGYIRVVGHSSSRTANMSAERHMEIIFRKSQDRADAVAQEIIREGVPADKVLVEAVGDTQPVYYESMPKGEDGNRRAEIFLQS